MLIAIRSATSSFWRTDLHVCLCLTGKSQVNHFHRIIMMSHIVFLYKFSATSHLLNGVFLYPGIVLWVLSSLKLYCFWFPCKGTDCGDRHCHALWHRSIFFHTIRYGSLGKVIDKVTLMNHSPKGHGNVLLLPFCSFHWAHLFRLNFAWVVTIKHSASSNELSQLSCLLSNTFLQLGLQEYSGDSRGTCKQDMSTKWRSTFFSWTYL